MAEAIFNKIAPDKHTSTSVGTFVFDKEGNSNEGEKLSDRIGAEQVIEAMREFGIEAGSATRKQITEKATNDSDIVIVMAEKETWPPYLLNNTKVRVWEIVDPKGKNLDTTRALRDQIKDLVSELVVELN